MNPARVTRVYDRIAPIYDLWNAPMEWLGLRAKRRRLLAQARRATLEAGIGTGRNLELDPDGVALTGIDLSARMLAAARRRAAAAGLELHEVRRDPIWREVVARPGPAVDPERRA